MNIVIRQAQEKDYQQIIGLFKEFATFQKMPDKMTNSLELMLEENEYFNAFVAVNQKDEIIGYASWFFAYYTWIGKSLYLDDIYVKQDYRRKGIGLKLMLTLFDLAKKENCKKVRWQVSKWNKNAIEFYKNLGADIDDIEMNCDFLL